jgi:hypothetical protein
MRNVVTPNVIVLIVLKPILPSVITLSDVKLSGIIPNVAKL